MVPALQLEVRWCARCLRIKQRIGGARERGLATNGRSVVHALHAVLVGVPDQGVVLPVAWPPQGMKVAASVHQKRTKSGEHSARFRTLLQISQRALALWA